MSMLLLDFFFFYVKHAWLLCPHHYSQGRSNLKCCLKPLVLMDISYIALLGHQRWTIIFFTLLGVHPNPLFSSERHCPKGWEECMFCIVATCA